jgi:hypothetical protein
MGGQCAQLESNVIEDVVHLSVGEMGSRKYARGNDHGTPR